MDVREKKQSLFYAAMFKHFGKVVVAGDILPAGSYSPSQTKTQKSEIAAPQAVCDVVSDAPPDDQ